MNFLNVIDIEKMKIDLKVNLFLNLGLNIVYVVFNMEKVLFDNVKVC